MNYARYISRNTENYLRSQYRNEARIWLESFDAHVARLICKWKLTLNGHEAASRFGTILYATSDIYGEVAVKIVPGFSPRLLSEIACYRILPYSQMCPVYDVDTQAGAILLKYVGGDTKAHINEGVFASLKRQRLSACQAPDAPFELYSAVLERVLANAKRELRARADARLDALDGLIERALVSMPAFSGEQLYIIHGDAHEYNMLNEAGECVLIDPLGYIAPFAFEYARYIGTKLKPVPMPAREFRALVERVVPSDEDVRLTLISLGIDTTLRAANTFIEGNTYAEILESVEWARRAWRSVDEYNNL